MAQLKYNTKLSDTVTENDLELLENKINGKVPEELRLFYLKYGSGVFFENDMSKLKFSNTLLHPIDIIKFINREDDFEFIEDAEIYDERIDRQIPFFDVGDGFYLTIAISGNFYGKVMSYDTVISKNFNDFVNSLIIKPNFYSFIE